MAIAQVCGAECGLASGNGNGVSRDRHWNAAVGTTLPIADTARKRTGNRSFKFVDGATQPYIQRVGVAATNTVVGARFYVNMDTITADTTVLNLLVAAGTSIVVQVTSGGLIRFGDATLGWLNGDTMVADTWNGIEVQLDLRANPNVVYLRTDVGDTGTWTDYGTANMAQAATTNTQFRFGMTNAAAVDTLWIDDIVATEGTTLNEHYPMGSGYVLGYQANASTVALNASGDLKYNNSTNITAGATDLHTYVDDVDGSGFMDMDQGTTDYISQNVADGANDTWTRYGQYQFEDSSESVPPRWVNLLTAFRSASTTANELNTRASDDGTNWTAVWGAWTASTNVGLDVSETTQLFLGKILATKPSGGAWTDSAFDSFRVQVGHSDDINPVPFLDFIGCEVEFAPATVKTGTITTTGGGTTVEVGQKNGLNTFVDTGGGVVVEAGQKNGLRANSLTGGGVVVFPASKQGFRINALTGGGTVTYVMSGDHNGLSNLAGGGTVSEAISGSHLGTTSLTGGGVVDFDGSHGTSRTFALTGGGTVTFTSTRGVTATFALTGGGVVTFAGVKGGRGTFVTTGGGTVVFNYDVGAPSETHETSWTTTGGGTLVFVHAKGARRANSVAGGGTTVFSGLHAALRNFLATGGGTVVLLRTHDGVTEYIITGGGTTEMDGWVEGFVDLIERYFSPDPPTLAQIRSKAQGTGINATYSRPGYPKRLLVVTEDGTTTVEVLRNKFLRFQKMVGHSWTGRVR